MNELELLKDLRSEIQEPAPESLRPGEARLVAALRERRRPAARTARLRTPARRFAIGATVGGVAALALAAGVLVALPADPGPAPPVVVATPEPIASTEVLDRAAAAALAEPELNPRPDQYLVSESMGQSYQGGSESIIGHRSRSTTWMAVDGVRDGARRTTVLEWRALLGPPPAEDLTGQTGELRLVTCVPADQLPENARSDYAFLATLPTDPQGMLAVLQGRASGDPSAEARAMTAAVDMLEQSYLPPAQRAAIFQALKLVPDVVVVEGATDVADRAGIALTRVAAERGERTELVFDPVDFRYLGFRMTLTEPRGLIRSVPFPPGASLADWTPEPQPPLTADDPQLPVGTVVGGSALLSWSVSDTAPDVPAEGKNCG